MNDNQEAATKLVAFDLLEVGERFFDPNTAEDFAKMCGNAAEHLTGGNYHSGRLMTFDPSDLVLPTQGA
jgi:hypothetical protein